MLRVFGCISIIHNMVQRKDLTAKAKKMIHLGVAQDLQGWVFWDPHSGQLCRSSLVVFLEEDFLLFPAHSTTINQICAKDVYDNSVVREFDAQESLYNLIQVSCSFFNGTPSTYPEAMNSEDGKAWKGACKEDMKVWNEVKRPTDKQVLGTRWVFATKSNQQGEVICYKARLVVQGHHQVKGVNFEETFATLWSVFAIASAYKWRVTTFDVMTAYLHSQLDEDIYVKEPPGVKAGPGMVFKLRKVLYGLKQAGQYDGVMATSHDTLWEELKKELTSRLKLKWDKEINSIVGIETIRKGDAFILKQTLLINKLLLTIDNNFTAYEPLPQESLQSNKASQINREYLSKIVSNEHGQLVLEGSESSYRLYSNNKKSRTSNKLNKEGRRHEDLCGHKLGGRRLEVTAWLLRVSNGCTCDVEFKMAVVRCSVDMSSRVDGSLVWGKGGTVVIEERGGGDWTHQAYDIIQQSISNENSRERRQPEEVTAY
ncbi:hypothetical protein O181_086782 [Austropuccinia psidii MF-1]|uniref:Reverse transcriptase Ty1/copia-type domain-containing protein n=1 Tax=Austropuccinia psidii MF-1 TaxID=1389203 RepID=A0A9Q3G070_9BASI|nr:hypothetical protein [Austropuccinia psidii MF-1]